MPRPARTLGALAAALLLSLPAGAAEPSAQLSPPARWLQQYLRIDTTNPPGNEHRAAGFLEQVLARQGVPSRLLVTPSGRTNLYARLRARQGVDGPALLLLHHMDVVAPGPNWRRRPFGGELHEGSLYGRGAIDAKSLGVAQLAAFLDLVAAGRPLRRDVVLLAVADEERGGGEGTAWLLERHPELFTGVTGVLNEGGSNRQVNGRLLWWGVEVAQKRPLWLEVSAQGRGGHGAGHNPRSAPHELLRALGRLVDRPLRWRVSAPARAYLRALAPLHNEGWRPTLLAPEKVIGPTGPLPSARLLPGMDNLFLDTVQVNVLAAAAQVNVVPPRAVARVDVRLLPDTDAEAFLAEVRRIVGEDVRVDVLLTSPPAAASPTDTSLHRQLERVLAAEAPLVPFFSPGFTDSRLFRSRGIPAYGFSPFAIEPQDLVGIHGADEHIPVAAFDRGVERLRRIVRGWAYGET